MNTIFEDNLSLSPVTTSGAQTVSVYEFEPEENSTQVLDVTVNGRASDGASFGGRVSATIKRGTGNATLVDATAGAENKDVALLLASITIDVSGTLARVRATGVAGADISWWGVLERVTQYD